MITRRDTDFKSKIAIQLNLIGEMTKMTFLLCYEKILCSFIEASFYDDIQMDM